MDLKMQAGIHSFGAVILMMSQGLLSVLAVRIGSYADAGILSLATSLGYLFGHIGNYGLRSYMITDVQERYTQADYQLVQNIMIVCSAVFCSVYVLSMGHYQWVERGAIMLFVLYLSFNTFSDLLLGRLQLNDHLEINGYSNILRGILGLMVFTTVYEISGKLLLALIAMALSAAIVLLIYDCTKYRQLVGKVLTFSQGSTNTIFPILKTCLPLMLANALPIATTAISRQIIHQTLGQVMLGIFSSVFLPTSLLTTVAPNLILVTIPKLAGFWHEQNRKRFSALVLLDFLVVVFLDMAGLAVAVTMGAPIMKLLFGAEILGYIPLLYLAIFVTGFNAACMVGNNVLISMRKGAWITISAVVSVIVTSVLSGPLIVKLGIYGAAYALMAAYGIQMLCQVCVILHSVFFPEVGADHKHGSEI